MEPFLETKGMCLSKSTLPGLPVLFLLVFFFWIRHFLCSLDVFNLFTKRKGRLEEAIEQDRRRSNTVHQEEGDKSSKEEKKRWYDLITPEMFYFTINSLFLNRTKASLRLNYEPLFEPKDAMARTLAWFRDCQI